MESPILSSLLNEFGYRVFFKKKNQWIPESIFRFGKRLPHQVSTGLFGNLIDPYTDHERAHRAIFVHIPKTAGTAVSRALFGAVAVGHFPISKYLEYDPDLFHESFRFSVVRNPWDRLVSGFHYLKQGGMGKYDRLFAARCLSRFDSFADFVDGLSTPGVRDDLLYWTHFRPQSSYLLVDDDLQSLDYIGRFENLDESVRVIAERLKIADARLERVNYSRHRDYTEYYDSPELVDAVGEIYRQDVDLFGYAFGD